MIGISRSSKTPTSIYLANRGYQDREHPARAERAAAQIRIQPAPSFDRRSHHLGRAARRGPPATARLRRRRGLIPPMSTRVAVSEEVVQSRRLFSHYGWPVIDVTRRSIEETAAAIISLYKTHRAKLGLAEQPR